MSFYQCALSHLHQYAVSILLSNLDSTHSPLRPENIEELILCDVQDGTWILPSWALSRWALLPGSQLPLKKSSFLMHLYYKEAQAGSEQAEPRIDPRPPALPGSLLHRAGDQSGPPTGSRSPSPTESKSNKAMTVQIHCTSGQLPPRYR